MKHFVIIIALLIGLALPAAAQPLSKAECRELATSIQEFSNGGYAMQQAIGAMAEGWDGLRGRMSGDMQRYIDTVVQPANRELQRAINNVVVIYDSVAQSFRACAR